MSGPRKLILTAILCLLPSALKAEFVSIPTVLTVHGLNISKISCDPGSIQGTVHNEACYAAASLFSGLGDMDFDESYLDYNIRQLCGPSCAEVSSYTWGGDIKNSRAAVDGLKPRILELGRAARKKGAPFIIIAHSWGTVLVAEALAELEGEGSAGELTVDKLVTMGSPLQAKAYSLAVGGLICGQGFYEKPFRAASVKTWLNYYADRDLISAKISFADQNIKMDADQKYETMETAVRGMAMTGYNPDASGDMRYFSLDGATVIWHASYFREQSIYLKSLRAYMTVDALNAHTADYFRP